jgi:23S rRNA C2498 (ribose-2'-O)-methylase RlmM
MKEETALTRPGWRPSFSRPGLVTWSIPETPIFSPKPEPTPSVFAHTHGWSLGIFLIEETIPACDDFVKTLPKSLKLRLHCYARPVFPTRESRSPLLPVATSLQEHLRNRPVFFTETTAKVGEVVFSVLVVDLDRVLLGWHVAGASHAPWPGGDPGLLPPAEMPSRAWLKFEEAMRWHPAGEMKPGQTAIEIGCAPGGTARAMKARGARVIGIEPAALSPTLGIEHIRKPARAVEAHELPSVFDWLLIDINDNPGATIRLALRFARYSNRRPALLLTLKTADWAAWKEIPGWKNRLATAGYRRIEARQLYHGRREIVLMAR